MNHLEMWVCISIHFVLTVVLTVIRIVSKPDHLQAKILEKARHGLAEFDDQQLIVVSQVQKLLSIWPSK